jgi:hypothetical protein
MIRPIAAMLSVGMSVVLTLMTGCGKSQPETGADSRASSSATSPANAGAGTTDVAAAMNTVSQFLDAVRRGGDTGGAHALLTAEACGVLERLGRTVQPIGSPDASFTVTRSEAVEGHPNAALVHSTWSEPSESGTSESYQVVWALQLENRAWKISGLAMELDAEQPPMIVDFEDYAQMASLFRTESDAAPENSDPAARGDSMSQAPQSSGTF